MPDARRYSLEVNRSDSTGYERADDRAAR